MSEEFWNQKLAVLESGIDLLEDKPEETPQSCLKALWLTAAGTPSSVQDVAAHTLGELDDRGKARLDDMIERRLAGEPVSYITGRQSFMGLEFMTSSQAMIPRKETEILAVEALGILEALGGEHKDLRIVDVCTGSGNLPVTFALRHQDVRVSAADLSLDAVELARKNAALHNVSDRIDFQQGDLLDAFAQDDYMGTVDIITCNPPYISSAGLKGLAPEIIDHEPEMAFSAGAFGVDIINRLVATAPKFLKPDTGILCFEVGKGQGPFFIKRLEKNNAFRVVKGIADENGEIRVIRAQL